MLDAQKALSLWEEKDGRLFWLKNPGNGVKAGDEAGCSDGRYWVIGHAGKRYYRHRIIWLMKTGLWPKEQIDHKDTNKRNDIFSNLREATSAQNLHNQGGRRHSLTGVKGVSRKRKRYRSQIKIGYQSIHLGTFDTIEEAASAYAAAAARLHGEFSRVVPGPRS